MEHNRHNGYWSQYTTTEQMQALPNKKRESKWAGVWEFIGLVAIGASAWAMSIMVLSI